MERWELHKIFSIFSRDEILDGIQNQFRVQNEDFNEEGIKSLINELTKLLKNNN